MTNRIIKCEELKSRLGKSYTTIWRWYKSGNFPKPKQLGPNSIGWLESDISEWENNLPEVNLPSTKTSGI